MSWKEYMLTLRIIYRLKSFFSTTTAVKNTQRFSVVSSFSCPRCCTRVMMGTNYGRNILSSAPVPVWKSSSNLYCSAGNGRTSKFSRNVLIVSLKRDLSLFSSPVLQKDPGKSNGDDGDVKNGNTNSKEQTPKEEDKLYDPKEDIFFTQDVAFGSKENKGIGDAERPVFIPDEDKELAEDIEPPTNCCQSGCPNCVWIKYVEKLTKKYTDPKMSREKVLKELDSMDDQNIKAFIMMELRARKLI